MGNQGKSYSERVSKMSFFDDFSQAFHFQILNFSENEDNSNVLKHADQCRKYSYKFGSTYRI